MVDDCPHDQIEAWAPWLRHLDQRRPCGRRRDSRCRFPRRDIVCARGLAR